MVVAVVSVRMVKVPVDEVVDVIAVPQLRMAAVWSVNVARSVPTAVVLRRASIRVLGRYLEDAFVNVVAVYVVQMPIVEVIDVIVMLDGEMTTSWSVLVLVIFDCRASCHFQVLHCKEFRSTTCFPTGNFRLPHSPDIGSPTARSTTLLP